jgi:hypothetical protein
MWYPDVPHEYLQPPTLQNIYDGLLLCFCVEDPDSPWFKEARRLQAFFEAHPNTRQKAALAAMAEDYQPDLLQSIRHFVRRQFGDWNPGVLGAVVDWLVAEHGMTPRDAWKITAPELLARLKSEAGLVADDEQAVRATDLEQEHTDTKAGADPTHISPARSVDEGVISEDVQRRIKAEELPLVTPIPSGTPKRLLKGWHEISSAIGMKYTQRDDVKSLNTRFQGPIRNSGPGTQPMVYENDLIDWWNKLALQQQELKNQRDGARLSAEAQHNFGRDGAAAPEIGGGIKKRRRDKQT